MQRQLCGFSLRLFPAEEKPEESIRSRVDCFADLVPDVGGVVG